MAGEHGPARSAPPERLAARLEMQAAAIPALLDGRAEEDLERRSASGGWSAREQLAHLTRYHELFLERLDRMRGEDAPRLGRYRAEDDPRFPPFLELPTVELLRRFGELRRTLITRVAGLTEAELARTGIHPAFGEMPVSLWIEFFLAHEGHHLYVILQRVREGGAAPSDSK
ncbi:MAG TPA: DinB family protein [Gemmatimonadaceae bacterium]|nr:DinB family protein [Gemmatimonadaceae bacterium]